MSRTVLVTDAARGSAVTVVRSLASDGWTVVAADPSRLAAGRFSRGTAIRATYPDPTREPEAAVDAIVELSRHHHVNLIVPVTDDIGAPLDASRHRLPPGTRLAAPAPEVRRLATDKAATVALARQVGVPLPDTIVVDGPPPDARAVGAQLGWPVVVKPANSRDVRDGVMVRREVTYAASADELERRLRGLAGETVLLQSHVPGEGVGVELLCDDGHPVAAFQHRRLREVPRSGGPSAFRESAPLDPILLRHSMAVLEAARWTGLAMVEWKVGPHGAYLMEINGRIWGSLPLAVAAGVDFPRLLAEVFTGGASVPGLERMAANGATPYPIGVRSRNLELEIRWIAATLRAPARPGTGPSRTDALRVAAGLLDPRNRHDVLSRVDPLPGLVDLARLGVRARRRLMGDS